MTYSENPYAAERHQPTQAIGLDVGGTKIAGGVVTADGDIVERISPVSTPVKDQTAILATLFQIINGLQARHPQVKAIGVGAAGLIEWPDGYIRWVPNKAYQAYLYGNTYIKK
jgi:glucokinase